MKTICYHKPSIQPRSAEKPLLTRLGALLSAGPARLSLLTTLVVLAAGCCFNTLSPSSLALEKPALSFTSQPHPRGVVVVIHGLNQRPTSMDTLCTFLRDLGFHTYRITLTGHAQLPDSYFTSESWQHDVQNALTTVSTQFPDLPMHVVGYSLGGLLATRVIDTSRVYRPASLVLIAPALSLRMIVQSAYLLTVLPSTTLSVRNLAPRDYKLFNQTPLFWYENTISIYDETRLIGDTSPLRTTPTLVIANPRDELISFSGLKDWISDNHLAPGWRLVSLEPHPRTPFLAGHIMIDERSLGASEWAHLTSLLRDFLRQHSSAGDRSQVSQ